MTEVAAPVRCPLNGKYSYETETDAHRALHKVRKARAGRGPRERGYYECAHCQQWHLTSRKQEKRG